MGPRSASAVSGGATSPMMPSTASAAAPPWPNTPSSEKTAIMAGKIESTA
ncbi:Uncharacterised protein [Mycobacterium tuberculosis]|nr:Uncharacterised protein [Mycobacterium tuberculosis]